MNKEIYLLYMRAKPQEKGYQKRLKDLWDENYPELDQMNGKQLAQQVRNIKTKKFLSERVIQLLEQSLNRSPEQNGEELLTQRPEKQHKNVDENVKIHEQNIEIQNENVDIQEQSKKTENQNEHSDQMSNKTKSSTDPDTKEYLSQRWNENFQKYINKNVDDRGYSTTINPPPSENYLTAMNEIVEERMAEILERHGNNLWTLNVIYYTTAITLNEKEGKLREVKKRSGNEVKPGWEIRTESLIEAIRRKLSYMYVLIECNKNQRHTKNQKNIRRRIEKQYGKTTTSKLEQIQNHAPKASGEPKTEKKKKIPERRYINRVFKLAPKRVYRLLKGEGKSL